MAVRIAKTDKWISIKFDKNVEENLEGSHRLLTKSFGVPMYIYLVHICVTSEMYK